MLEIAKNREEYRRCVVYTDDQRKQIKYEGFAMGVVGSIDDLHHMLFILIEKDDGFIVTEGISRVLLKPGK